jgi:hypothetical protein
MGNLIAGLLLAGAALPAWCQAGTTIHNASNRTWHLAVLSTGGLVKRSEVKPSGEAVPGRWETLAKGQRFLLEPGRRLTLDLFTPGADSGFLQLDLRDWRLANPCQASLVWRYLRDPRTPRLSPLVGRDLLWPKNLAQADVDRLRTLGAWEGTTFTITADAFQPAAAPEGVPQTVPEGEEEEEPARDLRLAQGQAPLGLSTVQCLPGGNTSLRWALATGSPYVTWRLAVTRVSSSDRKRTPPISTAWADTWRTTLGTFSSSPKSGFTWTRVASPPDGVAVLVKISAQSCRPVLSTSSQVSS